jgi:hypothetical protein
MNPSTPQFNEGVRVVPQGTLPVTGKTPKIAPYPDYYQVIKPPLPINSAKGGTETSKYAQGEKMTGKGNASELMKPVPRPEPGKGAKVPGTNKTIGGPKGSFGGRGGGWGGGGRLGGGGGLLGQIK